ncbi:MAG: hypothetical protein NXI02_03155 [Rhodobacteraceae bacterium]|nr:hypothetical protein [Paracoccaceae bacterium]
MEQDIFSKVISEMEMEMEMEMEKERGVEPSKEDPPSVPQGTLEAPNDDLFSRVIAEIDKERGIQPTQTSSTPGNSFLDFAGQSLEGAHKLWESVGVGIGDAAIETKDFIMGEPEDSEKSDFRREWERQSQDIRGYSTANNITASISQFATGLVGAGKLTAPIKGVNALKNSGKAGRFVYEAGRGALAGAVVIDPHEERLSNIIEDHEALSNPVTEYLAADPTDSAAEGRLKNALEGIGMDLALVGAFALSIKAVKFMRGGDQASAQKVLKDLEANQAASPRDEAIEAAGETPDVLARSADEAVEPNVSIEKAKTEAQAVPASSKDPKYEPRVEVEGDPNLGAESVSGDIVKGAREDFEAITKYGSREEAIANGHKFSNANLPWQKLNTSDEVQTLVANTAKSIKDQMDAAKGGAVLKDAKVVEMVRSTSDLFGQDPEVVLGALAKAGDNATTMVADMEASYIVARKMFEEVADLATKIQSGLLPAEFGTDIVGAQRRLVQMHSAAADMMAAGASMRAAAGRAVRRNRADFAITKADIENFSQIPPERLTEVLASTKGDLKKLRQTVTPGFWRRVTDEAGFLLTNNLLWNWTTHAVNTTTNLYMLAARPGEKYLGSLLQGSRGSAVRQQAAKEYAYTIASLSDAWTGLVDAFLKGDSILSPHTDEYFKSGSRVNAPALQWKPIKDSWDLFQNGLMAANFKQVSQAAGDTAAGAYRVGVGLPTRSLGAFDEFVKTLRYRAVVQARAAMEAGEVGLKGQAFKDHMQRSLDDSLDVNGRALDAAALQEAQVTTFQQDLLKGTLGKAVQDFRHNVPATVFILPFIKTPVNVLRYGWKMTPGLNMLQTEYRQMLKGAMGAEAQAHAMGQMALGSTFAALAATLAYEGRITGSGPNDPKIQKQLRATGWQPYSIVMEGEDAEKTYFPIGRFDPVGMVFGMAADIVDMQVTHPENKEAQKGAQAMVMALARSFTEKTFLMNLNQALRALSEPEGNLHRYAGQLAGNLIPGSSGLRNYANSDQHLREARTFMDHMLRGMPGYSETLPPQRDSFGDPLWRRRGLSTKSDADLVDQEYTRIVLESGYGIYPPTPRHHGLDLRDVTLSDGRNAFDVYQEYAAVPKGHRSLKEALSKLIQSESYDTLVDEGPTVKGSKLYAISGLVSKYRKAAWKRLLWEYPELRREVTKKQADVREAVKAKRKAKEGPKDLKKMLEEMGY